MGRPESTNSVSTNAAPAKKALVKKMPPEPPRHRHGLRISRSPLGTSAPGV